MRRQGRTPVILALVCSGSRRRPNNASRTRVLRAVRRCRRIAGRTATRGSPRSPVSRSLLVLGARADSPAPPCASRPLSQLAPFDAGVARAREPSDCRAGRGSVRAYGSRAARARLPRGEQAAFTGLAVVVAPALTISAVRRLVSRGRLRRPRRGVAPARTIRSVRAGGMWARVPAFAHAADASRRSSGLKSLAEGRRAHSRNSSLRRRGGWARVTSGSRSARRPRPSVRAVLRLRFEKPSRSARAFRAARRPRSRGVRVPAGSRRCAEAVAAIAGSLVLATCSGFRVADAFVID